MARATRCARNLSWEKDLHCTCRGSPGGAYERGEKLGRLAKGSEAVSRSTGSTSVCAASEQRSVATKMYAFDAGKSPSHIDCLAAEGRLAAA